MDQMKPQLEIEEDSQLLYAQMRHTKHYFASVKQLSQINSLNISLKQCSCVISLMNNGMQHAYVWAYPVDEDIIAMLNAPNNALIGEFIHQHPMGPIVWEQTWYEQDAYYCENIIIITNIANCTNNSSPITSTTSGETAEEYSSEYMVKEKASLKRRYHHFLRHWIKS